MAPIEKKRQSNDLHGQSRKKRKYEARNGGESARGTISQAVSLEKAAWHEVPFPETFEDAEGFFGLEEVSDVEVVRDSGNIEYRISSNKSKANLREKSRTTSPKARHQERKEELEADGGDSGWEGFEDHEVEEQERLIRSTNTPSAERAKSKASKTHSQKNRQESLANGLPKLSGNAFQLLGDKEEGQNAGENAGEISAWRYLNLCPETLSSLARLKFSRPTPIQSSALPHILAGHDAICKAPTGSGKTLAFGIPIYEHHYNTTHSRNPPRAKQPKTKKYSPMALLLSPTRELAHQLSSHLMGLSSSSQPRPPAIVTLTGGLSLLKQQRLLETADIIIGTPGRLWEIMQGNTDFAESLKMIKFLVLDEADRLLSSGHFQELEEILNALDRSNVNSDENSQEDIDATETEQTQTLVFSATFQKDLQQRLAGKSKSANGGGGQQESMEYLLQKINFREPKPKFIDVNPVSQMASGLKEGILECAGTDKDLYLYSLLLHHSQIRTLIFTNSINSVRRLTPFLQNLSLPAYPLHSQMPMKARLRSIERFSSPSSPTILIATDVAARGLDIPSVQLVIHYHLPRAADMYVHRSGRTARAEKSGSSILLCAPEEVQGVRRLIAKVHARNAINAVDKSKNSFMQTIELDRRIIARVKQRVALSTKISNSALANEKKGHEDNWLKSAAEDLGVEYDSEEFAAGEGSKKGRGQGRKKREKEARELTKGEIGAMRAELKALLKQRVNVGVSERYLTAGGVDIDELLDEERQGEFLGRVDGNGMMIGM